jgi:hypothetical protein
MTTTQETLQQLYRQLRKSPGYGAQGLPDDIVKAISQATGLVWYDLEPYAKLLYPVITPLRNEIPRVKGQGGTATHWVSVTGINVNNVSIGLGEGHRGGTITTTVTQNLATYKSFGLDDSVTFEADLAAVNLDDAKQIAVDGLLRATMIGEEKCIVGGNSSLALGTTGTPTLAASTTGGSLSTATYSVICVALSYDAFVNGSVANGIAASITRTNTDGTTDTYGGGSAQKSANATVAVTGPTGSMTASVAAKPGAMGYAWFWGAAGSEVLGAITSINSVSITAAATGTQTAASLPASDNSTNALLFDGLITQIFTANSGAYQKVQPTGTAGVGTPLTADGAGGIVEIDTAFQWFWDNYRLSPQAILMSSQELMNLSKKSLSGGSAPLFRFVMDYANVNNAQQLTATAGTVVGQYLNKFTMAGGQLVKFLLHPNVPPGTLIFYSRSLPYPLSNIQNLLQMKLRRDYYQIEWPTTRPAYEFSVWANGLLQNFFPPAFGAITNIGNG